MTTGLTLERFNEDDVQLLYESACERGIPFADFVAAVADLLQATHTQTTERTEYRVVQIRDERSVERYHTDYGRTLEEQESLADLIRTMAGGDVRVQSRTVTESPWTDLPEEGER